MRPLAIVVAVAGLVASAAIALSTRDRFGEAPMPLPAETVAADEGKVEPRPRKPVPSQVRPVSPERVPIPPVEQRALERVEDREPLSPIGRAQDPADGPPKPTILYRPLALGAGLFRAQGHTVALAGIEPLDAEEECTSAGVSWPCGIHGRTAFRNWLRGRALTCVVSPVPLDEVVTSDCTLGRQNPAEWLVAYGWVRALPDGPYAELEAQARGEARGIFGPAPAVTSPEPLTLTLPEQPLPEPSND